MVLSGLLSLKAEGRFLALHGRGAFGSCPAQDGRRLGGSRSCRIHPQMRGCAWAHCRPVRPPALTRLHRWRPHARAGGVSLEPPDTRRPLSAGQWEARGVSGEASREAGRFAQGRQLRASCSLSAWEETGCADKAGALAAGGQARRVPVPAAGRWGDGEPLHPGAPAFTPGPLACPGRRAARAVSTPQHPRPGAQEDGASLTASGRRRGRRDSIPVNKRCLRVVPQASTLKRGGRLDLH